MAVLVNGLSSYTLPGTLPARTRTTGYLRSWVPEYLKHQMYGYAKIWLPAYSSTRYAVEHDRDGG